MNNQHLVNIAIAHINDKDAHIGKFDNINDTFDRLGHLAWDDKVQKAKLGETIIEGGYLKTDLIEANSIGADLIKTNELVVGDNIAMGPNAKISWENLVPEIIDEIDENKLVWKGSLDDFPSNPQRNDMFYHNINHKSYIWAGTQWFVMSQDGTPGAEGPQGPKGSPGNPGLPGEFYAPAWIKATSIDMRSISSPMIYANNASIVGTLSGGILEGTRIRQFSGSTMIADMYKDDYGGKFIINNSSGGTCITMGSESGYDGNRNGTIVVYDGSVARQRIALGIRKDTGFGVVNIKGGTNTSRLVVNSIESYAGPHIVMLGSNGTTPQAAIRGEGVSYFAGGNVAIGKTSASYALDVQGDIRLSGSLIGGDTNGETGTFKPTDYNSIGVQTSSYGHYYKIGKLVWINGYISISNISGSKSILFGGLPYSSRVGNSAISIFSCTGINNATSSNQSSLTCAVSDNYVKLNFINAGGGGGPLRASDINSSKNIRIYFGGVYNVS